MSNSEFKVSTTRLEEKIMTSVVKNGHVTRDPKLNICQCFVLIMFQQSVNCFRLSDDTRY